MNDNTKKIFEKYPNSIPIHLDKKNLSASIFLPKVKYICPRDFTISQFIIVLRTRAALNPTQTIFLSKDKQLFPMNAILGEIYDSYCQKDEPLVLDIRTENAFG